MSDLKITKPKRKKNYINNKDLYDAMVMYNVQLKIYNTDQSSKKKPPIPEYVGKCIMEISQRLANKFNFSQYTYKDDMIGDGIENAIKYIDNFNPDKYNNPFAYFTTIINYCFIRRIQKEKLQQYTKYKNLDNMYSTQELIDHGAIPRNSTFQEHSQDFVRKYEKSMADKKAALAEKKVAKAEQDAIMELSKFVEESDD